MTTEQLEKITKSEAKDVTTHSKKVKNRDNNSLKVVDVREQKNKNINSHQNTLLLDNGINIVIESGATG